MKEIIYRNRGSNKLEKEKVLGKRWIKILYSHTWLARLFSFFALPLIAHLSFFSKLYAKKQRSPKSRTKIPSFINTFNINMSECLLPVKAFPSFHDFFIRKLKPEVRPIAKGESLAILPADGRYLVYSNINKIENFNVKGQKFDLLRLLQNSDLFERYKHGSMVIARLCPTDYHRFHFPCECLPSKSTMINGPLYSVNPIALKQRATILTENKRMLTQLKTHYFGTILYIEIGATFVGSIQQTYTPEVLCKKGEEKGYFEFGGSCIILLFEPKSILFDQDLIHTSRKQIETKAHFGSSLGKAPTRKK